MSCLIVDTSSEQCLLALVEQSRVLDQKVFAHCNLLSKLLLPEIQSLLQKNGMLPSQLRKIAIGIGPGSYTGTRLGVSVGKSLAFGLRIPLIDFPSPLAFLPEQKGNFAFLMPTRAGLIFLLKGAISQTSIVHEKPAILPLQELIQKTQDTEFFIAPSAEALPPEITNKPFFKAQPNIENLCLFLLEKQPTPPENAELLYLHTPF